MKHVIERCRIVPTWLVIVSAAIALTACQPQIKTTDPPANGSDVSLAEIETLRGDLIGRHNARIALLNRFRSLGVLEFRWVDDEGDEHFEPQINARIWLHMPRHIALRGEKLGETLLWLGSDNQQFWLFDLTGDEGVLYLGRHEDNQPTDEAMTGMLVPPLALKDLLGLSILPPDAVLKKGSEDDPAAWSLTASAPEGEGLVRLWYDDPPSLPVRIEILNLAGELVLVSTTKRYRSAPATGVAQAGWPRIPTLIDIADTRGSISIKLALDGPTADVVDEDWDRLFDLDRLMEHLGPDRIEPIGE